MAAAAVDTRHSEAACTHRNARPCTAHGSSARHADGSLHDNSMTQLTGGLGECDVDRVADGVRERLGVRDPDGDVVAVHVAVGENDGVTVRDGVVVGDTVIDAVKEGVDVTVAVTRGQRGRG